MCCELCGHDAPNYEFVSFAIHGDDMRPVCASCFSQEVRQQYPKWSLAWLRKMKDFYYGEK